MSELNCVSPEPNKAWLSSFSDEDPGRGRRRHRRFPFGQDEVLVRVIKGQEAGSEYAVSARDLSAGGLSLVFRDPLPAGTDLGICLTRRDGIAHPLRGTVVHSTRLGYARYAIGIRLNGLVDPLAYTSQEQLMPSSTAT